MKSASIVDDLTFLRSAAQGKKNADKWLGPTWDQWARISVLSGMSREAADHEIRQAILSGDVIAVWDDKQHEFCLAIGERS